jgi:hypothetical protein
MSLAQKKTVEELPLSPKQAEYIRGKYAAIQGLLEEVNAIARFVLFEHGTPDGNWSLSECRTKLVITKGNKNAG